MVETIPLEGVLGISDAVEDAAYVVREYELAEDVDYLGLPNCRSSDKGPCGKSSSKTQGGNTLKPVEQLEDYRLEI